jgi:hypothetical protein
MDKRYQVFVSSTYRDLKEERREVMQALLEMNCIPAGMELFPAADDSAWDLIKTIIKQSDYYVIIIGGRYGSTDSAGIGFTEKEYDYAARAKIPILPFLHGDPGKIAAADSDLDKEAREKLSRFRKKVEKHHCKYWMSAKELGSQVSRAMVNIISTRPAVGWVRANQPDQKLLAELNKLRMKNDELEEELKRLKSTIPSDTDHLVQGDDPIPFGFTYKFMELTGYEPQFRTVFRPKYPATWDQLFATVGTLLLANDCADREIKAALESRIPDLLNRDDDYYRRDGDRIKISDGDFGSIKLQLTSLGLIEINSQNRWTLTPFGRTYLTRVCALTRRAKTSEGA